MRSTCLHGRFVNRFVYMILQACELGLGTCWVSAFQDAEVKDILNIPGYIRVVALSPLGYPTHKSSQRPRKSLEEIVCYDEHE